MSRRTTAGTIARLAAAFTLTGGFAAAQPPASASPPEAALPKIIAPKTTSPGAAEEAPPGSPPPAAIAADSAKETPAPAAPAPPKPPAAPARRTRYDIAVIEALDKVTAESLRFEAPVGRPIRYRTLIFTVKACERSAPDEAIDDSIAYLTIDSQPRAQPGRPALAPRQAFKGWMYASSPSLNPLQHPVYDAWLITCRAAAPVNPPAPPAVAPPVPKPAPTPTSTPAPAAKAAVPAAPPKLSPPPPAEGTATPPT